MFPHVNETSDSASCQLTSEHCIPCEGGVPPLDVKDALALHQQLHPAWQLSTDKVSRSFKFKDFATAFVFAGQIAEIAETEGHHPDLHIGWGYVTVELTTHAANGLTQNDFIIAAKIDALTAKEPDTQ